MRTDHAHPVAVEQWPVERTLAYLGEQAEASRLTALLALRVAAAAMAVAVIALCLAIR